MRTHSTPSTASASSNPVSPAAPRRGPRGRGHTLPGRGSIRPCQTVTWRLAERGVEREVVERNACGRLHELGVVTATEACRHLHHLAVRRGRRGSACTSGRRARPAPPPPPGCPHGDLHADRARPGVGEGDAVCGRISRETVGDRQGHEDTVGRERVDRHLRAIHELLDQVRTAPRCGRRDGDGGVELARLAHDREAALTLLVDRFDDTREERRLARATRGCGTPVLAKRSRCRVFVVGEEGTSAEINRMKPAEPLKLRAARCSLQASPRPGKRFRRSSGHGRAARALLVLGRDERALGRDANPGATGPGGGDHLEAAGAQRPRAARAAPAPAPQTRETCSARFPEAPATTPRSRGTTPPSARALRRSSCDARQPVSRYQLVGRPDGAVRDLAWPLVRACWTPRCAGLADRVEDERCDGSSPRCRHRSRCSRPRPSAAPIGASISISTSASA